MENKKRLKNLNSWFYFNICEEYYKKFMQYEGELISLKNNDLALDFISMRYNLRIKRDNFAFISLIFAVMHLEAFIYDYAIINLPKKLVDEHIDRLDTVSKWMIVVQLATGKKFPRSNNTFRLLKELIKYRNKLVHSKSKFMEEILPFDVESLESYDLEMENNAIEIAKQTHNAYKTIKLLYELLYKLDENKTTAQTWRLFFKNHNWLL